MPLLLLGFQSTPYMKGCQATSHGHGEDASRPPAPSKMLESIVSYCILLQGRWILFLSLIVVYNMLLCPIWLPICIHFLHLIIDCFVDLEGHVLSTWMDTILLLSYCSGPWYPTLHNEKSLKFEEWGIFSMFLAVTNVLSL